MGDNSSKTCYFHLSINIAAIKEDCKSVVLAYKDTLGDIRWNENVKEDIVPRIHELIESLPIYARSGRESELTLTMELISGYVTMMGDDDDNDGDYDNNTSLSKAPKKRIKKTSKKLPSTLMYNKLSTNPIRQCLVGKSTYNFIMVQKMDEFRNIVISHKFINVYFYRYVCHGL